MSVNPAPISKNDNGLLANGYMQGRCGVNKVKALINKYNSIKAEGKIKSYDEANTCKDFILPLFEALGWDISNREEVTAQASASRGRVDYAFCIKGIPKFFLEAKSLKVDLNDTRWAEQTINYAWHKGVVWAVLTDFEAIKVFNAEWIAKNPNESLFFEIRYDKYSENFDQLSLLSKQAFLENRLDKEAEKWGKKRRKIPVDEKLLSDILKWRNLLANSLRKNHPALLEEELDESIQRILDRLIFIRTCEDRNIEPNTLSSLLREFGMGASHQMDRTHKRHILSEKLKSVFRNFDEGYNSQIFSPHLCEDLKIDEDVLEVVINGLYATEDRSIRYDFSAIDADVLGSMYEQYLGHILKKTPTRTTVTEKHLHRKEMGIYYTPKYIVDYIVKNTVGEMLKEKSYKDAMKLKILDPACGSGSFLIRAFEEMDNYLKEKRSQKGEEFAYFRRMEILNSNLYGVDLDKQAVEIAQLNLLLKALETRQKLPVIKNIRRGNSLISGDDLLMYKYFGKNWKEKHPFNWKEEYSEVFKDEGFDVIIGNPPYVFARSQKFTEFEKEYYYNKYGLQKYQLNTYGLFVEMAYNLLKPNGVLGVIIPNNWLTIETFAKFREFVLRNGGNLQIINIYDKVFSEANVDTCILILSKGKTKNISLAEIQDGNFDFMKHYKITDIEKNNLIINIPLLKNVSGVDLLTKVELKTFRLNDIAQVSTGLKAYQVGKGIPKQTEDVKTNRIYHATRKINSDYYPYLEGKDVSRYNLSWSGEYLKYGNHLAEPRKSVPFKGQRILVRQIPSKPPYCINAVIVNKEVLHDINSMVIFDNIQDYDLRLILGIINSKLISYWFLNKFGKLQRKLFPQFKVKELQRFPIAKNISKDIKISIINLVEKMLELNKQILKIPEKSDKWYSLKSEIEKTDKKIDEIVYDLYGITEKERKIIEKSYNSEKGCSSEMKLE